MQDKIPEIKEAGFTHVWLPPPSESVAKQVWAVVQRIRAGSISTQNRSVGWLQGLNCPASVFISLHCHELRAMDLQGQITLPE